MFLIPLVITPDVAFCFMFSSALLDVFVTIDALTHDFIRQKSEFFWLPGQKGGEGPG
jgi:hypothetical protein